MTLDDIVWTIVLIVFVIALLDRSQPPSGGGYRPRSDGCKVPPKPPTGGSSFRPRR